MVYYKSTIMSSSSLITDTASWVSFNALVGITFGKLLKCVFHTEASIVEYSSLDGFKQILGIITRYATPIFT